MSPHGGGVTASTVSVSGLGAGDATVYDANGKNVTGQTDLSRFRAYTVKYRGSIADSTQINNGDTATFTLPSDVQIANTQTCNVYDQNGNVAGTATIQPGSQTGTITFNNDLHGKLNRQITLSVGVIGTTTTTTDNSNAPSTGNGNHPSGDTNPATLATAINKVGWYDKDDNNLIHWDIVANLHNANLKDPVITDNMGPGMELVQGSVKVQEGYYDNGTFTGAISAPNPQVTTNGSQITISVPSTNLAIHVSYEVKITNKDEANYENKATISAANLSQTGTDSATLPGELKGNVTFDEGGVTVLKEDATTKKPLAGAKFGLFTKDHQIVGEETTGADGEAHFGNLNSGDYVVKEIAAPSGYEINNQLYPVTVPDSTTAVNITVPDQKKAVSSSSSSKMSSSSSSSKKSSSSSSSSQSSSSSSKVVKSSSSSSSSRVISSSKSSSSTKVLSSSSSKSKSSSSSTKVVTPSSSTTSSKGSRSLKSVKASSTSSSSSSSSSTEVTVSSSSSVVKSEKSSSSVRSFVPVTPVQTTSSSATSTQRTENRSGAQQAAKSTSKHLQRMKGLPDTGDMVASGLVVAGMIVLAGAGFILVRHHH
ncbi:LPXTG cell wall anchor domain-containing protein [Ligilactobacillus hohenheimensis]|uniref:LPXTG cell wall anchor domain-containing protein n=1 Tax=Ligilactobacillus hohenheimensis TaxID=2991832 RepID=UPI0024BA18DF|nr:LPXTG cell wall anchor domain-containing protein [Ligilactobacillus hohenheimensis]